MQESKGKKALTPADDLGNAFFPGKEAWKQEPGNRYTPEDMRKMESGWDIQIVNPDRPRSCSAD
jgi:hypothetical protein